MESPAKKARTASTDTNTTSTDNKRLSVDVEIGGSDGRGHGLFARKKLPAGWMFHDHPICIPCPSDAARRQLPTFDFIDELMQTIMETAATGNERFSDLIDGEWKMTHLQRHLDMQDDDVELPAWAVQLGVSAAQYNLLAAQLQSNVARDATSVGGEAICLNPRLRLANHSCIANVELASCPDANPSEGGAAGCSCGLGNYALRAKRPIDAGEELCFSYIGDGQLASTAERDERREVLHRRWGFWCNCTLCMEQEPKGKMAEGDTREQLGSRLRKRATVAPESVAEPPPRHPVHGDDTGLLPED